MNPLARGVVLALLLGYLPGALIFRLPVANRAARASLPAEERVFWTILLSVTLSSFVALGLASASAYRFERLLWIDGGTSLLLVAVARGRLLLNAAAPRPGWTCLLPLALASACLWINLRVPPSEYVMGGKDPGVYMNEGIQIAQRGGLTILDDVVRTIPTPSRNLFFPPFNEPGYYSSRFMGFFLLNPDRGSVVGQFPHLYPVWIAIGYGVDGLSGGRAVLGLWAILGILAVYFLGARVAGRTAAAAGAALLAVNVLQVWYARYPNAEMVMQPLVFAGLLAYIRAQVDEDRFFGPLAGLLFTLALFTHITGAIAIAAIGVAALVGRLDGQPLRASFTLPTLAGACLAITYYAFFLPAYFANPVIYLRDLPPAQIALIGGLGLIAIVLWRSADRPLIQRLFRTWFPLAFAALVCLVAGYGFFLRRAGGLLAPQDADALRTFASFYLSPVGLAAALLGFLLLSREQSRRAGVPFLIVFVLYSLFSFYKIRIIPEHFWAARRFVAVILPGMLLLASIAALGNLRGILGATPAWLASRPLQSARYVLGSALVLFLGVHYFRDSQPIQRHVEYAGLIPHLEQLAKTVGDDDLVLVEARNASDAHVLALPLAYIYARHVLVFATSAPDKQVFREFLTWARSRYRRIFFLGGGGTELLSRSMVVQPVGGQRFQVPEYESLLNAYPRRVTFKEFDFGIYEFAASPGPGGRFDLAVGVADDVYVRRFHAKELTERGIAYRWTRDFSYVSIVGTRPENQELILTMGAGGRPQALGPAAVDVALNGVPLGRAMVGPGMEDFRFPVPKDLAAQMARSEDAARLQINSTTWSPRTHLHANDGRELGVMLERVVLQ